MDFEMKHETVLLQKLTNDCTFKDMLHIINISCVKIFDQHFILSHVFDVLFYK